VIISCLDNCKRVLLISIVGFAIVGCHTKASSFYDRVYHCDPKSTEDTCGTTREGAPMMCYSAVALGGGSACVEACDPVAGSRDSHHFACLNTGALLQICDLTVAEAGQPGGCPKGLACLRTNLTSDQGLCLPTTVCTDDDQCSGQDPRNVCASSIIRELAPAQSQSSIHTDGLQCVQANCSAGSSCAVGEMCLGNVFSYTSIIAHLCLPVCDKDDLCPPGQSCSRNKSTAPGATAICLPGVLGARCVEQQDCLIGTCSNVGVEFNLCTFPCADGENICPQLNFGTGPFVCNGSSCVTPASFHGSNCGGDADCAVHPPEACFDFDPFEGARVGHGECRVPCDADGHCPSRGGLPHVCLGAQNDKGCFPGEFGVPCKDSSDCMGGLACLAVPPNDPRSVVGYTSTICTLPCTTDADCEASLLAAGHGYCQVESDGGTAPDASPDGQARGVCRHGGPLGAPCDRDAQCNQRMCNSDNVCAMKFAT